MKLPLLAKFKIFPRGKWFHFWVFVWKERKDMIRALKKAGADSPDCEGICCCYRIINTKNGKAHRTGELGDIHLHRLQFSMGVITHECGHAALYWAKMKGINPTITRDDAEWASKDEEAFCWVLGNLARQVVLKANQQWKW